MTAKVYSEKNPEGCLTFAIERYHECLRIDWQQLQTLMKDEIVQWEFNLSAVQKKADRLKNEIQHFLAEQKTYEMDLLKRQQMIAAMPKLRKLP